jgi:hypothetical protein
MKIDFLIIQLAIIFLPGIMWAKIDFNYASKIKPSEKDFLIRSFIFGIFVYSAEYIIFKSLNQSFIFFSVSDSSSNETIDQLIGRRLVQEIIWAIVISILFSVAWLYACNYKILTRFLQKIRATRKYGDEDVWDFLLNSSSKEVEYVNIRDFERKVLFCGFVSVFSETDKTRELVLSNVIVYDFDGIELYKTPRMYIANPTDSVIIEFPYIEPDAGAPTSVESQDAVISAEETPPEEPQDEQ